ncbi:hypothetical protein F9B74_05275 [Pelistega sp. NLN82]|uniref:Uncharacterized protein n=1 Tax=Pelistega ratti TaxID=2652177 RepID=A0A6L9Y7J4_9BURK|nr:hypothetical protein [Pelistega ratti]NEN75738.1 hypothetical protein [Pelistega ratti]
MSYQPIKDILQTLINENYQGFIKALISLEKGINDEIILHQMYEQYMENDDFFLLNDQFDCIV